ncbi:hypothetical protein [Novosphingobium soli]
MPLVLGVLLAASPAIAAEAAPVPGGAISTLPLGTYTCEMPGDASGPAGKPVPDHEFRVVNASSYKVGSVRGSYLFVGDRVTMTGGKLKGLALHRVSEGFLRELRPDGTDGEMRCVRTGRR